MLRSLGRGQVGALLAAPALIALFTLPAYSGGARVIDGTGTPMKWDTSSPVPYHPDQGSLGSLDNAAARGLVADAFSRWQGVPLATISFQEGPPLPLDVNAAGIPADNPAHWAHFWRVSGDGLSPVIFDADGSILDDMFGAGARFDLLGVAGLDTPLSVAGTITEASIILNGAFHDGLGLPGSPDDSDSLAAFQSVVVHEIGHFCNLDHSLVNRDLAGDGNRANDRYLPTMYPVTVDDDEALNSLNPDDLAALGALYPDPAFAPSTATVFGSILDSGGNLFQGAEVVIRKDSDPLLFAYSVISGATYLPCTIGGGCYPCTGDVCEPAPEELARKGKFEIPGAEPGVYTICVRQIDTGFSVANGTSVGPLAVQAILPGLEECFDSVESWDPAVDDPDGATAINGVAGSVNGPYEIRVNALPVADSFEPNDTLAGAAAIGVPSGGQETVPGILDSDDVDFYSFPVTGGETIQVDVEAAEIGSPLDAVIGFYAAGDLLLAVVDDAIDPDSGQFTHDPALRIRVNFTGTAKLAVAAYPDSGFTGAGGATSGPYYVRIRRDPDADSDGILDRLDVCPGDSRDDADQDGLCGDLDNCPFVPNPGQADADGDGVGDDCDNNVPVRPTAGWTAEGDQANASLGASVSTAGDVNGDGYGDVIVGAPYYDNGQTDEGRAYVYLGSAAGLSASPAWTAESDQDYTDFGYSVSKAGDVNGDGYDDVIVGAPFYDNVQANEGRAYIYLGSASGLSASPAWTAESDQQGAWFGWSVSKAGDVNGDGYDDVIVGAYGYDNGQANEGRTYLYLGSATGLSASPAWTAESDQASAYFGESVSTAGDVNGDGYDDVIVGARGYDNGQADEGRAHVYLGSAAGLSASPAWTAESDQDNADFGYSVSTAGDANGDGFDDVIVGAYYYDNGETDEGRAYLYLGSAAGLSASPAWTAESDQVSAWFGFSVSTAGDVNGDGRGDVIVGAPYYTNDQSYEGRAYVYMGSATILSASPEWTAEGDLEVDSLGWSVSTAGDVNGDGYDDVIVGAPYYDNGQTDEGRAYVYLGSAAGLSASPAWTAESDQDYAYFGHSVSTAGDVNGDGYDDVIVGAGYYDNGQTDEGRAYVYLGSAAGLSASPAWTAESDQDSALFGRSVSTAGDVNGDGYDDVIVGAPYYDNDQVSEGRVYVYLGSAAGLSASPAWTAESDQDNARFGGSVSTAGDVNGDGYDDVIVGAYGYDNGQANEGRAYVYLGSATGLSASPAWTAESDQDNAGFGGSVSTAGDVNGDGYGDVIVGASNYDNGQADEGRTYVYLGSATGLSTSPAWTAESDQDYAYFGHSVSTAGDVNGDGYDDVIVGAVYYDIVFDEGRAYVYLGSAAGLSASPAWTAESNQAGAYFGYSVSTAGDINGDGYGDVIVGAPWYDGDQVDEGRAFVYLGVAHTDRDGDAVPDNLDNCPTVANPVQEDAETAAGEDALCGTTDDNGILFGPDMLCGTGDDLVGDGIGDVCPAWTLIVSELSISVSYGAAWGDYDGDGDPDLYALVWPGANRLVRNDQGTFVNATSPPLDDTGPGASAAWGDYDRDGDLDLFLTNMEASSNRLFRNEGGGVFSLATSALSDATDGSFAAPWGDYDRDGDLDLYLAVSGGSSGNRIFRNEGDGSFTTISSPPFNVIAEGRSAAWVDYDGDGDLDLHVVNAPPASNLFRNNGDGTFTDLTSSPINQAGLSAAWGDYDNDGDLDVFICHGDGPDGHLLRNEGEGVFADFTRGVLRTTGGGSASWGDYDNDGDLDLYTSPGRLFRNEGGGVFAEVTGGPDGGPAPGAPVVGAAWADYDGDGRLDLYAPNGLANRLLRNTTLTGNHWLVVELRGTTGNRQGIGARVRVSAGGRWQIREISGGGGKGQDWQVAHFGLGDAAWVDALEVRWPSGAIQTVRDLPVDRQVAVVEIDDTPPQVTAVYPPDGSLDVAVSTSVILTLSEPVEEATADGSGIVVLQNGLKVPGALTVSADGMQVTFDPTGSLQADSDYTVQVTSRLLDLSGNGAVPFASGFDTTASTSAGDLQASQVGTEASGTTLGGENASDNSGFSTASVGDVNGDGIADLLVGAPNADTVNGTDAGKVRLVFGGTSLQSSLTTPLSLTYLGEGAYHHAGYAVSRAGDVNGDGRKDFLIGAPGASPNGTGSGRVYLVFGNSGLDELAYGSLDLGGLAACSTGTLCGIVFDGEAAGDLAGAALAYAGDINDDGHGDLLIGAPGAAPEGRAGAGKVYLVYGPLGTPGTRSLSTVGVSTPGLVFYGESAGDAAGTSVSSWPDPTTSQIDDLLIGAPFADATDEFGVTVTDAGYLYAIHGGTANLVPIPLSPATIQLSRVASGLPDQVTGIVFIGSEPGLEVGRSTTGEVDFDGDGVPDVIFGANGEAWAVPGNDPKNVSGGTVITKQPILTPTGLIRSLGTLGAALTQFGATFFTAGGDGSLGGLVVGAAGDVNNDGIEDFIVGAPLADPAGILDAGKAYVLYGATDFPRGEVLLSDVGTTVPGLTVQGAAAGDRLGSSVGGGFDVNGDGIDDALAGAPFADTLVSTPDDAGETYVISPVSSDEVVLLTVSPSVPDTITFLEWTVPNRAISYNLYRWTGAALKEGGSVQTSNATRLACGINADANTNGLPDTSDATVPDLDSVLYYLVTAENLTGEGPLGPAGADIPRINDLQCP